MCGFAGYLSKKPGAPSFVPGNVLRDMANAILNRGPDSDGYWIDTSAGIGLAHRRLAILDLSPTGSQPMTSPSGRYVLAFNGEIYNHPSLRSALEIAGDVSAPWRGGSDTETLLAGFDAWGLDVTLNRAIGMFSMALWDREQRSLTLIRDRFGEKPLYYGWQGSGDQASFLFGSELSALSCHPSFLKKINRNSLSLYMRHNCIGGSNSIYADIYKLLPGHLLSISSAAPEPVVRAWWSGEEMIARGVSQPFMGSPDEAVNELEFLLRDAVGLQMMADVPLGAFLSGGVDSSTVVALMQAQSSTKVRTFSIGFDEADYNEAKHAKAVAKHLGTDHTELYVTPKKAMDIIPNLPKLYSEPFADSSQISTFLVSQLASQSVKVSLSGDAGDELFCGYSRYQMTANLWRKMQLMPPYLLRAIATFVISIPPRHWDRLCGKFLSVSRLGDKLHKGANLLNKQSVAEIYLALMSHWPEPDALVLDGHEPATLLSSAQSGLGSLSEVERMMALDMLSYLPDDILTKVDRAAMGVSLETRVPMLDHRVVDFAWSLPLDYKLRGGVAKWPLREVLYRYVPRSLIDRPKMGFGVPIDSWLRGPLRDWADSLLSESRLRDEGFFNPILIRQKWVEHLSGQRNWQHQLWGVLMFQAWFESQNER